MTSIRGFVPVEIDVGVAQHIACIGPAWHPDKVRRENKEHGKSEEKDPQAVFVIL